MRPQLQSQQILLAFLGFYKGKCDGIWGPDSIAAMRSYEASPKFSPGYPSNGLPLKEKGQLPSGVYRRPRSPGILSHVDMPDDYAATKLSELVTEDAARKLLQPKQHEKALATTEVAVEVKAQPVAPSVEVEAKSETVVNVERKNNQHNQHHDSNKPYNKHNR